MDFSVGWRLWKEENEPPDTKSFTFAISLLSSTSSSVPCLLMMLEARSFHGIPPGPLVPLKGKSQWTLTLLDDWIRPWNQWSRNIGNKGWNIRVSDWVEVSAIVFSVVQREIDGIISVENWQIKQASDGWIMLFIRNSLCRNCEMTVLIFVARSNSSNENLGAWLGNVTPLPRQPDKNE